MLCQKPFRKAGEEFGCGQCLPCRINKRREWSSRLLLEAQLHECSTFVTLTYSDENLPKDGSLQKRDYQLFLKRLRERIKPRRISYYLVGEYGGVTGRPHYHCVLFGFGGTRTGTLSEKSYCPSDSEKDLLDAWSLGHVHVAAVTAASLNYACKHIATGQLKAGREHFDRMPEFHRMSLRPAIGLRAVAEFAEWLTSKEGCLYVGEFGGDAPTGFRYEGAILPFGRYLRKRIRVAAGLGDKCPQTARDRAMRELDERFARVGADRMKSIRAADGAKAQFLASVQKWRSKL